MLYIQNNKNFHQTIHLLINQNKIFNFIWLFQTFKLTLNYFLKLCLSFILVYENNNLLNVLAAFAIRIL